MKHNKHNQQFENIYDGQNISVNEAARIMKKSPMFVRIGLQRGILPFGVAFKTDESNEQYNYYISPKLFKEYTGYSRKEEEQCL